MDAMGGGAPFGIDQVGLQQLAGELAKSAPPPAPGSLNQLLAMMGAIKPIDPSNREISLEAMKRHYVAPPSSGGGAAPNAAVAAYQAQAGAGGEGSRGPKSLGEILARTAR